MKRIHWGLLAALAATGFAAAVADDAPRINLRGIVRAGIDRDGRVHGDFAKQTGLKKATSLNYKIVLIDPATGKEKPFDEKKGTLKIGDQFRLWIESHTDAYVYVFHEGPDGVRTALVPDKVDKPGDVPMVKADKPRVVPHDGTYFEAAPPTGNEILKVFASPERRPELTPKEAFEDPKTLDKTKQIEIRTQQDKVFESAKKSGPKKTITTNDVKSVAENNEQVPEYKLRGLRWEPSDFSEENGRTVVQGAYDENVNPELFVEIKLTSK